MKKTCVLCGTARAQRPCPARGEDICPLCCGKSRQRTVDCPEDCRFLEQARAGVMKRLFALAGEYEMETEWADVVHNLRLVLVNTRRKLARDLSAQECAEAANNVISTLSTKSKGLIYEYRSPNQRVQLVADALAEVASAHAAGQKGLRRAGEENVLACLRYLKRQLAEAEKRGVDYVDLAGQLVRSRQWQARQPEPTPERPIVHSDE